MLKQALGRRGGVVKEQDGFEVFFEVERPKVATSSTTRSRKSVDMRDGFDKFYGIPSATGVEEDSSSSPRRCQEDRITAHRSPSDEAKMGGGGESNAAQGQPAGVPAGVPTFHLAEPALPKGVETFSICQKTDRRVEETT